jgi:hypothetical protein
MHNKIIELNKYPASKKLSQPVRTAPKQIEYYSETWQAK